jgi:UDP-N-acetylmuramoyl-tripeptide--D-alanyl-D-alanine ligase
VAVSGALQLSIQTQLVGTYNLPNVLCAVTIGNYFGVPAQKIQSAIEHYSPSNSRSQWIKWGNNEVILDAYNANPSSMKVAVENFAQLPGSSKILMLGAMMELGDTSIAEHQALLQLIEQYPWEAVVLVGGDFAKLTHPYIYFADAQQAKEWLQSKNPQQSLILLKGSRSMQMEKVIQ